MANALDKALNPVDNTLEFIQESFNINGSISFDSIVKDLNKMSANLQKEISNRDNIRLAQIERLLATDKVLKIIDDRGLYSKFNELANAVSFSQNGAEHVLSVSRELVYDLENARNWLGEYQKLIKNKQVTNMDRLIKLGQSILARAVELCPIDTGLLRSSGTLIVYQNYIVIVFAAPYATYVHENLENYHKYGRAKFLEAAIQEFLPNKRTWVDIQGEDIVYAKISMNSRVTYKHHGPY